MFFFNACLHICWASSDHQMWKSAWWRRLGGRTELFQNTILGLPTSPPGSIPRGCVRFLRSLFRRSAALYLAFWAGVAVESVILVTYDWRMASQLPHPVFGLPPPT